MYTYGYMFKPSRCLRVVVGEIERERQGEKESVSEKERVMRTAGETHYECDRERERVRDMNERARVVPPAMDRSQKTARGRYSIAYIIYIYVRCRFMCCGLYDGTTA